jgi:hypothetical protein
MMLAGSGAENLFSKHSKDISNRVAKYISNPNNKSSLKSKDGAKLLENHQKIVNYSALKSGLESCVSDDQDDLMLKSRLIDAAGNSFSLPVPCRRDLTKSNELDDFMNSILSPTQKVLSQNFEQELSTQALDSALNTLIKVKYKYEKSFMRDGTLRKRELNSLIAKVCSNSPRCQEKDYKEKLKEKIELLATRVASEEKKRSPDDVVKSLSKKVSKINDKLEKINFEAKERWYWTDYADMEDPSKKAMFRDYINTYLSESSSEDGALLLTDSYRKSSGALKSYSDDSDNIHQVGDKFVFKSHKSLNKRKVKTAVNEVKKKINEQIRTLIGHDKKREQDKSLLENNSSSKHAHITNRYRKKRYKENREEAIKELIKRNPVSAGQVLLKNPEYSHLACAAIKEITNEKRSDDQTHQTAVLLGAVGGGLLIATGVGAVAGGWLLTGSLTAGVAAGTVGGTILTATTTSALVLGGAETAYFSNKAYDDYQEAMAIDRAILSDSADKMSIEESRDEMISFKEARFEAALALGFTAIDLGAMKGISILAKGAKGQALKLTSSQRSNLKNIYSEISNPNSLSILKESISKMGKDGAKEFDQFLGILSTSNKKWQKEFLKQLENSELSPSEIKRISKEVLESQKLCKK